MHSTLLKIETYVVWAKRVITVVCIWIQNHNLCTVHMFHSHFTVQTFCYQLIHTCMHQYTHTHVYLSTKLQCNRICMCIINSHWFIYVYRTLHACVRLYTSSRKEKKSRHILRDMDIWSNMTEDMANVHTTYNTKRLGNSRKRHERRALHDHPNFFETFVHGLEKRSARHVCVDVCMRVCMRVCMFVCMFVCKYAGLCVCVYACLCTHMNICARVSIPLLMRTAPWWSGIIHTYIHTYIHACMHIYICIHMYLHIQIYIHTFIHTHTHIYIYTYTYNTGVSCAWC